jgi:hypothetical protein
MAAGQTEKVQEALNKFLAWLEDFGETSFDHQSFYAGPLGRRAKELYYRAPVIGILAVSPMVFFEAFLPSARTLFWKKMRLPIADAHYAMGFALLHRKTGDEAYYRRATDYLNVLKKTRSPQFANYCWGYPFDWITQKGTIARDTPLITTTPYVYEAFDMVHSIDKNTAWLEIMRSIAEHAMDDIGEFPISPNTSSSGYFPGDPIGGVINASAYRAFLLTRASLRFGEEKYLQRAERYLNFVLQNQQSNGSWRYEAEGTRDFVDHFHTCFVMKALAKIEKATSHRDCRTAIEKGVKFYLAELFDEKGIPKPFSKAPRLTVYRNELYDYAECLNLGVLLNGRFQELDVKTNQVLSDLLERWQKKSGSFRSRKLIFGWDNTPMHRWGQSQIFRSLCLFLDSESSRTSAAKGRAE